MNVNMKSLSRVRLLATPRTAAYQAPLSMGFSRQKSVRSAIQFHTGFPGGSDGRESAGNARDPGSIPRSGKSPGEGNGNSLQDSCLENSKDRGAGYSPWNLKEWDTTKQLTLLLSYNFLL